MDTVVKIEFGSRCPNHGLPECLKMAKMLFSFFPTGLSVLPSPMGFFNHFRVYIGENLVFDSCSRYPPVIEVVKCVEEYQQESTPAEIPHSRGIPFSYWRCPEHEGMLVEGQVFGMAGRSTQRLSCVSSKVTSDTSSSSDHQPPYFVGPRSGQQRSAAAGPQPRRRFSRRPSATEASTSDGSDAIERERFQRGKREKKRPPEIQ